MLHKGVIFTKFATLRARIFKKNTRSSYSNTIRVIDFQNSRLVSTSFFATIVVKKSSKIFHLTSIYEQYSKKSNKTIHSSSLLSIQLQALWFIHQSNLRELAERRKKKTNRKRRKNKRSRKSTLVRKSRQVSNSCIASSTITLRHRITDFLSLSLFLARCTRLVVFVCTIAFEEPLDKWLSAKAKAHLA